MNNGSPLPTRDLKVSALAIDRGGKQLLENLTFSADAGESVLIIGPNGAGKTSLLLCLAGILRATAGKIEWQGRHDDDRPGSDIHFIGHRSAVKPGLTVFENLSFWANVYGTNTNSVSSALEQAGLGHAADFDAAFLSAGQTRRLALARLIAAPRPIWLLDEPTSALDAAGDKWICALIDDHISNGGMVITATHLELNLKSRPKTLNLGDAQ